MTDAGGTARDLRLAGWAAWALLLAALASLGWLRHADHARAWETPGLGAPLVLLRGIAADSSAETWLVAVNPDCPHCLEAHARLAARRGPGPRVGALIVDTPRRPGAAVLAALGGGPVWWDARDDWRRRWGHRIYGEVLCFDRRGRYLVTLGASTPGLPGPAGPGASRAGPGPG
jgi:hypothetical protein